jgi:hypothetical protein
MVLNWIKWKLNPFKKLKHLENCASLMHNQIG